MKLIIIGRDSNEANIVLSNPYVSGYHAEIIQLDNGDMYIVDKSSNGTFVNGNRLTPGKETPIHRGDSITFADCPLDWSRIEDVVIPSDVKKIISIGSHFTNDITVDGANVSRFHATIRQMADGKWFICDHSKNGTTVNGRRIPKDKYVKFTAKDEISCAGIPINNPIPKGSSAGKIIGIVAASLCACALLVFGGIKLLGDGSPNKNYTVTELCAKYDRTTVLMFGAYHFKVSCGTLKISDLPDPDDTSVSLFDEFVVSKDGTRLLKFNGSNYAEYHGTGFFVGSEGNIVTNRHIALPWESDLVSYSDGMVSVIQAAEDCYKGLLTKLYEKGYTVALQYISQVKVTGVLDYCFVVPNHDYLDEKNTINCHLVSVADGDENDLAIFKIRSSSFPAEATYVPVDRISTKAPEVGTHVVTMGFPLGTYSIDGKTQIQATVTEGSISRTSNQNSFVFTAPAYHGSSGSPVFDDKGFVVGVLWGSYAETQGFTHAVKSSNLVELINKAGITK